MRSTRTLSMVALLLMFLSAFPALCVPLSSIPAPPPVCHQHHGTMPAHTCCRSTPSAPAALQATFHEETLEVITPVVIQFPFPINKNESVFAPDFSEFSSPPPSVLRI